MDKVNSLVLRITERCNLNCAYCYAAGSGCPQADMPVELACETVALCCPEGGSLRIQFTGGEPLLNLPVMEAVYRFGRETGRRLRLAVQTNGTLLAPDTCRRLAAMNCALGVSLDGPGEANRLRSRSDGTPSFTDAVQGIRNWGTLGRRCNLTVVVTRVNAVHLGQLADLALWLGNVSGVGLDLFRPLGRGSGQELTPDGPDLAVGLRKLIHWTKELQAAGIPFRLRELERAAKRQKAGGCGGVYCYAQTEQSLAVDGAGNCWPCSSLAGRNSCLLGNIRDGLPHTARSTCGLDAPAACTDCGAFSLCGGGCPAGRTGGTPDPMVCVMHHILTDAPGGEEGVLL